MKRLSLAIVFLFLLVSAAAAGQYYGQYSANPLASNPAYGNLAPGTIGQFQAQSRALLNYGGSDLHLYDRYGQYHGNLDPNPYNPNSINNPYGRYGSPFSPDSIKNPYSVFGSPYSVQSPNNPFGQGLIIIQE